MAANVERFRAADINVLAITQAKPELLTRFLRNTPLPFPLVGDPDRAAYRALSLGRTNWFSFIRPSVLFGFARHVVAGVRPRVPYWGQDVLQLGGDFLLDRAGRVVFAHRSRTAVDRPGVDTLLAAAGAPAH